jgi:serine protease Do
MNRTFTTTVIVAAMLSALLGGFLIAGGLNGSSRAQLPRVAATVYPAPAIRAGVQPASSSRPAFYEGKSETRVPMVSLPDFADLYERVSPAVASISSTKFTDPSEQPDSELFQDPFRYFFGPDQENPHGRQQPRREESGGTGFVITPDGYLLTNYHVVEGADLVRVALDRDGQEFNYEGRVVGTDPATDLALVKIETDRDLVYLPLGDSDRLRVGEWVMAIGNPFFYEDTLTVGVVSAKGRRLTGLSRDPSLDNYIQTDAAINVGNSGGPLMNLRGEVVGINTAVSRVGQGIGFAIPIGMAKLVVPQLRESGRVARGAIGVTIIDIATLDADDREYWGLNDVSGAVVQDVTTGQPAAKAGLRPGDAVIAMDGQPLESSADLISRISAHRPGESIKLTYLRDGRRGTAEVRLEDRESILQGASITVPEESGESERAFFSQLGIEVAEVDATSRRSLQIPADVSGVIISDVSVRGDAYEKGLRPGMVILEVNRQPVSSLDEYQARIETVAGGGLVNFYIWTRGQGGEARSFVTFRVDAD